VNCANEDIPLKNKIPVNSSNGSIAKTLSVLNNASFIAPFDGTCTVYTSYKLKGGLEPVFNPGSTARVKARIWVDNQYSKVIKDKSRVLWPLYFDEEGSQTWTLSIVAGNVYTIYYQLTAYADNAEKGSSESDWWIDNANTYGFIINSINIHGTF